MTTPEPSDTRDGVTSPQKTRQALRLHPLVAVLMLVGTLVCLWLTGVLRGNTDLRSVVAGVVPPVAAILVGLIIATVASLASKRSNRVFNVTLAVCMVAFLAFLGWAMAQRARNSEIARRNAADERLAADAFERSSQRFSQLVVAAAKQYGADMEAFMAAGGVLPDRLTNSAEIADRLSLAKAVQASHLNGCALISDAENIYAGLLREEGCPEDGIGPLTAAFRRDFDRRESLLQCEVRTRAVGSMVAFLEFLNAKAGKFEQDDRQFTFETDGDLAEFERLRQEMIESASAESQHIKARREREERR